MKNRTKKAIKDVAIPVSASLIPVLLGIIALAFIDCSRQVLPPATVTTTDSVRTITREVVRFDTVRITLPAERVHVEVPARDTVIHATTAAAEAWARLSRGLLSLQLSNRDNPIATPVAVKDTETVTEAVHSREETAPVLVPRELTWWQKTRLNGFWVLIAVVAFLLRKQSGKLIDLAI